jgi:S-layer domain protein
MFKDGEFAPETYVHTDVTTKLVVDQGLYFVNTFEVSSELYNTMGEEGSKVLNAVDRKNGMMPNVLSQFGAELIAKRILNNLTYSSISLKDYILTDKISSNPKMTKADFIVMAMNVLNPKGTVSDNFTDVTEGKYYYNAIGLAKSLGLIEAVRDNSFEPEQPLTGELCQSFMQNIFKYMAVNADFSDVYGLAKGEISPEIGVWAIDRLYEELNK